MHVSVCLQRSTKYLFKFHDDAKKLKASLHNKVGIVTAGHNLVKAARFAELYGMMKPAVPSWWAAKRCMTIWKKHLLML
jgi:hypothetical protein